MAESGMEGSLDAVSESPGAAAAASSRSVFLSYASPPRQTYERARRTLETAIKLDPSSGLAHGWLGWVHMAYDWDWETADSEMQQAQRLSPREPVVLLCVSRLAHALGHLDDAIRLLSSVLSRDPLYAAGSNNLSGRSEDALQVVSALQQPGDDRMIGLTIGYHAIGRNAESDAQLAALIREHADDGAFEIAQARAYRGEVDEAFKWLDSAYAQKDVGLYLVRGDILLRNIASDPRYKAFLKKMNLPE